VGDSVAREFREAAMAMLKKLFWWKSNRPVQRIRICVECGMPVAEHKDWCSIFRTLQASRKRATEAVEG
jgi:hypothetical protein